MAVSGGNVLRASDITSEKGFGLLPDAAARGAIAEELGISGVKKLRFEGSIAPSGQRDLVLRARLGATVVQPCGVTLEPVTTRIDADVMRLYLADMPEPEGDEVEMPEDDNSEPLFGAIDLEQVMVEALALELPPYPRAEGVEAMDMSVTEPGKTPLSDDDLKPFAGLADLKDKLSKDGGEKG